MKKFTLHPFLRLPGFILKNKGTKTDAQDIFQDAMLILYSNAKKPDFTLNVKPDTYLFSIARNLWLKNLRQKRHTPVTQEAVEVLMYENSFSKQELEVLRQRLYRKKLGELGMACRKLLSLFYEGTPMQTIAKIMGYASSGYARKKKFTCKQKLIMLIRKDPLFIELSDDEKL